MKSIYYSLIIAITMFTHCNLIHELKHIKDFGAFTENVDSIPYLIELNNSKSEKILTPDTEAGWIVVIKSSNEKYFKLDIPDLNLFNIYIEKKWINVNSRNYDNQLISFLAKPNSNSKIVKSINSQLTFNILEIEGNWVKVAYRNEVLGWIHSDMLCGNPYTTCP
jgi:uncharacterized protein YgiM (DUF1202 family)